MSESCPEPPWGSGLDRLIGHFAVASEASPGSYMAAARSLPVSSLVVSKSVQRLEPQSELRLLSRATERVPLCRLVGEPHRSKPGELWQQISDAKLTARKVSELDLSAGSPIPRGGRYRRRNHGRLHHFNILPDGLLECVTWSIAPRSRIGACAPTPDGDSQILSFWSQWARRDGGRIHSWTGRAGDDASARS
jgi:hypothetical protein